MAVPVRLDLMAWVQEQDARLSRAAGQGIERRKQRLGDLSRLLPRADVLLNDARQRLDLAETGLARGLERMVERKRATLLAEAARLRPALLLARVERVRDRVEAQAARLAPGLRRSVTERKERVRNAGLRLRPEPIRDRVARATADLNRIAGQQRAAQTARLARLTDRLEALDRTRRSLGYTATLARGYAVVRKGDAVVTGVEDARGAELEVEFRDGRLTVQAEGRATKGSPVRKGTEQGSLF